MNQIATIQSGALTLTASDIRAHVNLVQEVMKAVMKQDTHYGIIPGCKQPSLYKAGSEVLLSTFRIAVSVQVEDLSTPDCVHYRVRTIGTHQGSGIVVGEGIGECSSDETKYRWKRCYSKKEFDNTPENRRRMRYSEFKGKETETMEVRTEPADQANTILKMAKKRAQIDMTLTATAASDIFTQDVEDLPEDQINREPTLEQKAEAERIARQQRHDDARDYHAESIDHIKIKLGEGDVKGAYSEWMLIPEDDRRALWLAHSKGGCLTTDEQKAIKDHGAVAAKEATKAAVDADTAALDKATAASAPK